METNDTDRSTAGPSADELKHSANEELRRAGDHLYRAADTAAGMVLPPDLRHHLRSAARHLLQAGVGVIDGAERRARMRAERHERRDQADRQAEADARRYGATEPLRPGEGPIAGSHAPECM